MKFSAVIFTNWTSNKKHFIASLQKGEIENFKFLKGLQAGLFSKIETDRLVDLEERLAINVLGNKDQPLKTMSSGEQKKLLLQYLKERTLDYLILDDPFDCLDIETQAKLKISLTELSKKIGIIQLTGRAEDALSFCTKFYELKEEKLFPLNKLKGANNDSTLFEEIKLPKNINHIICEAEELIALKNVSVDFFEKPILRDISWTVKKGEFWQLVGPNGSGKSTLVGMITGDNSKGYGKDFYLFGEKKGSGESIWDIKQKVGYFSPAQIYNFKGRHTLLNMLISGYNDSVGLYVKPTEEQLLLAEAWLKILNLWKDREKYFCDLALPQQRLLMCARAMVKFPVLLILDEPTVGLDDANALLFISLINKIASGYNMGIIYVSHRLEANLKPHKTFILEKTVKGSIGKVFS